MSLTLNPNQSPAIVSMIEDTMAYAAASRASSTLSQYEGNWNIFTTFCDTHGLVALPTTPQVASVYLSSLAKQGKSVSTVNSHLAAIKYYNEQAQHVVNWKDPILSQVVAGIQRVNARKVNKADAILIEDLVLLLSFTGKGLNGLRDRALILTGFAGAFRRSELVALTLENTEIENRGMVLRLDKSKTDQEGKGADIAIPFAQNADLCPVRAVQAWLKASGITQGPLFRRVTKGGTLGEEALSEDSVRFILTKLVSLAGLDGKYSPHSLRAGFCTQAAMSGKAMEQIARHARHSNPKTTMGYVRVAERFANHAGDGLM